MKDEQPADRAPASDRRARLRALPSVDALAARLLDVAPTTTRAEATSVARAVLHGCRAELLAGGDGADDPLDECRRRLDPRPRRVLNATGVVLHTNLGRAPLARQAIEAVTRAAAGYVDLELDLEAGGRGARDDHVRALICELTGAQDALVVNNGAAAALLAVAATAGPGGSVVVSRGQLVEIGGGFRVPEVVGQAGARLVEVGTTNRTREDDYARALAAHPGAIALRVHPSNFRTVGFVEDVGLGALVALGAPVVDDIGSGRLGDLPALAGEPDARASVAAGAALTCFSADKLLGGPQAGILAGAQEAVRAARRHPLNRAVRPGRLVLAALHATLALHRDPARALVEIPALRMLAAVPAELSDRARWLAEQTGGELVETTGRVGGGALPLLELPGPAVALPIARDGADAQAARLRRGRPAVLARIRDGRVLLDPRTLDGDDLAAAADAVARA